MADRMYNIPVKEVLGGKVESFPRLTLDDLSAICAEMKAIKKEQIKASAVDNGIDATQIPRLLMQVDNEDLDEPGTVRKYSGTARGSRRIIQYSLAKLETGSQNARLDGAKKRYDTLFSDENPDLVLDIAYRVCTAPLVRDTKDDDFLLGRGAAAEPTPPPTSPATSSHGPSA